LPQFRRLFKQEFLQPALKGLLIFSSLSSRERVIRDKYFGSSDPEIDFSQRDLKSGHLSVFFGKGSYLVS
jgi:hypothetical protein